MTCWRRVVGAPHRRCRKCLDGAKKCDRIRNVSNQTTSAAGRMAQHPRGELTEALGTYRSTIIALGFASALVRARKGQCLITAPCIGQPCRMMDAAVLSSASRRVYPIRWSSLVLRNYLTPSGSARADGYRDQMRNQPKTISRKLPPNFFSSGFACTSRVWSARDVPPILIQSELDSGAR